MSAHYIYIACSTEQCDSFDSIYTGDATTENFEDAGPDSWEGETITILCRKCLTGREKHDEPNEA